MTCTKKLDKNKSHEDISTTTAVVRLYAYLVMKQSTPRPAMSRITVVELCVSEMYNALVV